MQKRMKPRRKKRRKKGRIIKTMIKRDEKPLKRKKGKKGEREGFLIDEKINKNRERKKGCGKN